MPLINYGKITVYKSALKAVFPTAEELPENYTTEQVAFIQNASSFVYAVPESGFYQVEVRGAGGSGHGGPGAAGGSTTQIIYLYAGQTCLLWGANTPNSYGSGFNSYTGYPGAKNNTFGGRGATGYTGDESGSGGGGAAENASTSRGYQGGWGGAGAGFLAGFTNKTLPEQTLTAGALTQSINRTLTAGNTTFTAITSYVLAGGGGGGCGTDGGSRSGGGGGGALGNGGNTYGYGGANINGESGPAGSTFGKGGNGGRYNTTGAGAWAILDFSRTQVSSGTGGGSAQTNGYCRLSKIIPQ